MTTSETITDLAAALAKAQGQIQGAKKDSANPFFKSRYADLASVWDACRGPLSAHGLSVVQSPSATGSTVAVTTRLLHLSGQWIEGTVTTTAKDDSPQSVGSAISYLRRYALQSFVGVAPADDDGEAAQGRPATAAPSAPPAPTPKGYDHWLLDLEAVADEGTPSLETAWKKSAPRFREYLRSTNEDRWEKIKARAEARKP